MNLQANTSRPTAAKTMGNIQIYMMIYLNENSFRFRYNIKDPVHGPYRRPMKPLFIEIQNFWSWADKLGRFEFEFGPQRIGNLAFVCP